MCASKLEFSNFGNARFGNLDDKIVWTDRLGFEAKLEVLNVELMRVGAGFLQVGARVMLISGVARCDASIVDVPKYE